MLCNSQYVIDCFCFSVVLLKSIILFIKSPCFWTLGEGYPFPLSKTQHLNTWNDTEHWKTTQCEIFSLALWNPGNELRSLLIPSLSIQEIYVAFQIEITTLINNIKLAKAEWGITMFQVNTIINPSYIKSFNLYSDLIKEVWFFCPLFIVEETEIWKA